MDPFLVELYRVAEIRRMLSESVRLTHAGLPNAVQRLVGEYLSDELFWLINTLRKSDSDLADSMERDARVAFRYVGENNSFAADMIHDRLIPAVDGVIRGMGDIDVTDDADGWRIMSTASGYLTLKDLRNDILIHSMIDPMQEAYDMAEQKYRPEKTEYVFLGCGLGYLPYQVYQLSYRSADIIIFERDQSLIDYALSYGVLSLIDETKLTIYKYDDINDFLKYIDKNRYDYYIFPSLIGREVLPEESRQMTDIYIRHNTRYQYGEYYKLNYYRNRKNVPRFITELKPKESRKTFIVVGGGPSVDDSLEYLKESMGQKCIICVGTIFAKLIKNGIRPDYVTVADAMRRMSFHFEDMWDETVPMLVQTYAYYGVAEKYAGEKYLMLAGDFMKDIAWDAKTYNQPVFWQGGSVTSGAIEAAVFLGAKNIELIGVDLAYPRGESHAKGSIDYSTKFTEPTYEVKDVNGNTVITTASLRRFKQDVEYQIKIHPGVRFINKSRIGARIEGTV